MKKTIISLLATVLLACMAFSLASCGGEKPVTTDATQAVTDPGTSPDTTSASTPDTTPDTEHEHVPKEQYITDVDPTCSAAGSKSYHCLVCGKIIPETVVEIPADPSMHKVAEWNESQPSFYRPGSWQGTCTLCGETVTEELEKSEPFVFVSNWDATERADKKYVSGSQVMKMVKVNTMTDAVFFPEEGKEEGNDLLVEFSFLWNETLKNIGGDLTVMHIEDYNLINISLNDGTIKSRDRAGDVYLFPSEAEIKANPTLSVVPIGDYGWHRLGVRIHQDAKLEGGELKQAYIVTVYLDGEKVLQIDKTKWVFEGDYGKGRTVTDARLYVAELVNGKIEYNYSELLNEIRICHEEFFRDGAPAYLVLADISITCGTEFVEDVVKAANPIPGDYFMIGDAVSLPGDRYFDDK